MLWIDEQVADLGGDGFGAAIVLDVDLVGDSTGVLHRVGVGDNPLTDEQLAGFSLWLGFVEVVFGFAKGKGVGRSRATAIGAVDGGIFHGFGFAEGEAHPVRTIRCGVVHEEAVDGDVSVAARRDAAHVDGEVLYDPLIAA